MNKEQYEIEICYMLKYLDEIGFYDAKILESKNAIKILIGEREKRIKESKLLNNSLKNLYFRIGIAMEAVSILLVAYINQKLFLKFPSTDLNKSLMYLFDIIILGISPFLLKSFFNKSLAKKYLKNLDNDLNSAEKGIQELDFSINNYVIKKEECLLIYQELTKKLEFMKKSVKIT